LAVLVLAAPFLAAADRLAVLVLAAPFLAAADRLAVLVFFAVVFLAVATWASWSVRVRQIVGAFIAMRTAGAVAPNMILTTLMRVVNTIRKIASRVATLVGQPMAARQDPVG